MKFLSEIFFIIIECIFLLGFWLIPLFIIILILFVYRILKGESAVRDEESYSKQAAEWDRQKAEQEEIEKNK